MIIAYLSYNLAALYSDPIAPRYFLAIPFTIITYKLEHVISSLYRLTY